MRYTVLCKGRLRQLFSVENRPSGDLGIYINHALNTEYPEGNRQVTTERISVHHSIESDPKGSTVKLTRLMSEGRSEETSQFRVSGEDGFVTLVHGALCTDLAQPRYELKTKSADSVRRLYKFDIGHEQLFYFLIVSDKQLDAELLSQAGLQVNTQKFSHFWLTIMSGFVHIPATPFGQTLCLATSVPRMDGSKDTDHIPSSTAALEPREVIGLVVDRAYNFAKCAGQGYERLAALAGHQGNENKKFIKVMSSGYSFFPWAEMIQYYRKTPSVNAYIPFCRSGNEAFCIKTYPMPTPAR